jgi:hypothetical protein
MNVQIRIIGGTSEDLTALGEWLKEENELRGAVRVAHGRIGDTQLGSVTEMLTVALGSGGAGAVLASSLKTWLATRRTAAKLTVESAGRRVTLDIETISEVVPLLEQILRANDDG